MLYSRVSIQYSSSTVKYLYLHSRMCVREYWSAYSQSVLSFSVHTACHTVHRQETMRKKMSYLSILLEMNWVKTLRKQGKCVPIMLNSDYNRVTPYMNWTGHEHTRMRLRYILVNEAKISHTLWKCGIFTNISFPIQKILYCTIIQYELHHCRFMLYRPWDKNDIKKCILWYFHGTLRYL